MVTYLFVYLPYKLDILEKILRCQIIEPSFIVGQWKSNLSVVCGVLSSPVMDPGYVLADKGTLPLHLQGVWPGEK